MIEKLLFGRTGHSSTRLLFGAAAFAQVTQAEADRTMDLLLQSGINHIDTAASYGEAELRIGPWMPRVRGQFFLASKTGERTYSKAVSKKPTVWPAIPTRWPPSAAASARTRARPRAGGARLTSRSRSAP